MAVKRPGMTGKDSQYRSSLAHMECALSLGTPRMCSLTRSTDLH